LKIEKMKKLGSVSELFCFDKYGLVKICYAIDFFESGFALKNLQDPVLGHGKHPVLDSLVFQFGRDGAPIDEVLDIAINDKNFAYRGAAFESEMAAFVAALRLIDLFDRRDSHIGFGRDGLDDLFDRFFLSGFRGDCLFAIAEFPDQTLSHEGID